jgi:hypothetical protein
MAHSTEKEAMSFPDEMIERVEKQKIAETSVEENAALTRKVLLKLDFRSLLNR